MAGLCDIAIPGFMPGFSRPQYIYSRYFQRRSVFANSKEKL